MEQVQLIRLIFHKPSTPRSLKNIDPSQLVRLDEIRYPSRRLLFDPFLNLPICKSERYCLVWDEERFKTKGMSLMLKDFKSRIC